MVFYPNSCHDPYFNQAIEQAVFELETAQDCLLIWRNEPAIVCGRNQNIFSETNVNLADKKGVALVRRDTGGGTVYHDLGNVNYALITAAHGGLCVDYDSFLDKAVSALNNIGVPAHRKNTCDIAIDDMKISGSAQRQTKTRVLHHGTLLYDTDLTALSSLSDVVIAGYSSKAIASNNAKVTNICDHTRAFEGVEDFMNRLACAFECADGALSFSEQMIARANELCKNKYHTWEWTFGKNPAFSCVKSIEGLQISYAAKHGIITDFSIERDGMCTEYSDFIGERLEKRRIADICKTTFEDSKIENAVYCAIFGMI